MPVSWLAVIFVGLWSFESDALMNWLADKADDAAKGSAYAAAVSDLLGEIEEDSRLLEAAESLQDGIEDLEGEIRSSKHISTETADILKGFEWKKGHLLENIRYTTGYIRRLKRLLGSLASFGAGVGMEGMTAYNTFETNVNINQVLKNQQAILLMMQQKRLQKARSKQRLHQEWVDFSNRQRALQRARLEVLKDDLH